MSLLRNGGMLRTRLSDMTPRLCAMVLALSVGFGSVGCQDLKQASADGERLDAEVHSAMQRGDWKSVYASADPGMRERTSEEKFGALFLSIGKKLGVPVSSKQTSWNLNSTTSGTYLHSQCETTFSNDATGVEDFAWRKTDGKYRLYGYHINSEELITR